MSAHPNSSTLDSALRRQNKQGAGQSPKWGRIACRVVIYAIVILGAVMMALPFVWLILSSFKTLEETMFFPPTFFPKNPTFANFREVFERIPFARYYMNSIITSVIPTIITVTTCSMAGFGFAKYKFTGRNTLFWIILATMMVPFPATIVPLYAGIPHMRFGLAGYGMQMPHGV